jgi:hypothetical protein
MNLRTSVTAAAVAAAVLLSGCSGTKATGLWRDPARQIPFKKILVAVVGVDMAARRNAEEVLVRRLGPGAIASYQVIPAGEEKDLERVKAILKEGGFDGALVCRLLGVDQELTTTTMPAAVNVYGYWGYSYTAMYSQQAVDVRKIARIESKLFDVETEKPVWAMTSETLDPSNRGVVIDEVTELVVRKMGEAGFLGGKK